MRVLVLFAHPALQHSRVHSPLLQVARTVTGVTVHDLYDAYPDFDIDVPREQALLREHDVLVWQHPFYWYSTPPIVKQWQDLVLEHGWAYGRDGHALRDKWWLHAVSTGGGAAAYTPEGRNRHTVQQLLAPLEQTARLCGLHWLPPFVVPGTHALPPSGIADYAAAYGRALEALRDGAITLDAAVGHDTLNPLVLSFAEVVR